MAAHCRLRPCSQSWELSQNLSVILCSQGRGKGIAKAKALGHYKGRKPTAQAKADQIRTLAAKGMKKAQIARELDVGVRSVFRVLGVN